MKIKLTYWQSKALADVVGKCILHEDRVIYIEYALVTTVIENYGYKNRKSREVKYLYSANFTAWYEDLKGFYNLSDHYVSDIVTTGSLYTKHADFLKMKSRFDNMNKYYDAKNK